MKFGEKNVGAIDRMARVLIGALLLAAVVINYFTGLIGYAAIFFGAILVATGLLGTCAIYSAFGFSTCGVKKKK